MKNKQKHLSDLKIQKEIENVQMRILRLGKIVTLYIYATVLIYGIKELI